MSPTSSQMQKVEPSRIVSRGTLRVLGSCSGNSDRAALGEGFHNELVDVDVAGPRDREEDALGDVFGPERVDPFVRRLRFLLVAAKANAGEVGLDEPRIDRRQPDRAAEQVLAERVGEAAHGELRGDVDGGVLVCLAPRDRAEIDDVAAVADVRQAEARHPDQAVDVRLEHRLLILLASLPKRVAAKAEAGVVDEDVESAEFADGGLDEPLAALPVRDVELEPDLGLQLDDAPRTACDASALPCERRRRRGADAARGARDDRGLSLERGHNPEEVNLRPPAEPRSGEGMASPPPPRRTAALSRARRRPRSAGPQWLLPRLRGVAPRPRLPSPRFARRSPQRLRSPAPQPRLLLRAMASWAQLSRARDTRRRGRGRA